MANFRKYIDQINFDYISDLPIPIEIIKEFRYKPWNLSKLKKHIDISIIDFPEFKCSIEDLNSEKNLFENQVFLKNLKQRKYDYNSFSNYENIPIWFILKNNNANWDWKQLSKNVKLSINDIDCIIESRLDWYIFTSNKI